MEVSELRVACRLRAPSGLRSFNTKLGEMLRGFRVKGCEVRGAQGPASGPT
jgi:hypothetical protein